MPAHRRASRPFSVCQARPVASGSLLTPFPCTVCLSCYGSRVGPRRLPSSKAVRLGRDDPAVLSAATYFGEAPSSLFLFSPSFPLFQLAPFHRRPGRSAQLGQLQEIPSRSAAILLSSRGPVCISPAPFCSFAPTHLASCQLSQFRTHVVRFQGVRFPHIPFPHRQNGRPSCNLFFSGIFLQQTHRRVSHFSC